jgi:hypothetical protein
VHTAVRQKRKKKKTMSLSHTAIISISYTTIPIADLLVVCPYAIIKAN